MSTLRTHIRNMSRSGSEIVGELLANLSKAFDCLPRWHLIAKLEEYGFSKISNIGLGLVFNYLPNHKQMVKINMGKFIFYFMGKHKKHQTLAATLLNQKVIKLLYLFWLTLISYMKNILTGLARKKKAGASSPLASFYPRRMVIYRWQKTFKTKTF